MKYFIDEDSHIVTFVGLDKTRLNVHFDTIEEVFLRIREGYAAEEEFEFDGVTFVVAPADDTWCDNCALVSGKHADLCGKKGLPHCMADQRLDKREIIWKVK